MFRTLTTAAVLALVLSQAASPALAGPAIVRFSDLDLSSAAGVQVLNGRIQQAAEKSCMSPVTRTSHFYSDWYAQCVRESSADMSARIAAVSQAKYRTFAGK